MLLFDDELPLEPTEGEHTLTAQLGSTGLHAIDVAPRSQATNSWRKVARVIVQALEAEEFPLSEERYVHLHLRRLIALVESGQLEAEGDLRNPRRSEVRLRGSPRSEPRAATPLRVSELRAAVEAGDLDQVIVLLKGSATIAEPDRSGWLPLHWAAGANQRAVVRFLISEGAPLEARATDLWTALHLACVRGSSAAVVALVRAGADVDSVAASDNTPLHLALVSRRPRTIRVLLLAGANPAAKDNQGRTADAIARADGLAHLASLIEECSRRRGLTPC